MIKVEVADEEEVNLVGLYHVNEGQSIHSSQALKPETKIWIQLQKKIPVV